MKTKKFGIRRKEVSKKRLGTYSGLHPKLEITKFHQIGKYDIADSMSFFGNSMELEVYAFDGLGK